MTTPNGAIQFESGVGSDSAASGLGPATALTGTGASTTASSAVVTGLSSTTGVTAGDLFYLHDPASGRQFSVIANVDSGTQVTLDDTLDNTESGRSYAIGGKRDSLVNTASQRLWHEDAGGFIIDILASENISSSVVLEESTRFISTAGTRPVIDISVNNPVFEVKGTFKNYAFANLKLTNSSGSPSSNSGVGIKFNGSGADVFCYDMVFGDATNSLYQAASRNLGFRCMFLCCLIEECVGHGVLLSDHVDFFCSVVRNNGSTGISGSTSLRLLTVNRCLIYGNGGNGVYGTEFAEGSSITNSLIHNNGDDGIDINETNAQPNIAIYNNIITDNTGYGINNQRDFDHCILNNWFNGNTTANVRTLGTLGLHASNTEGTDPNFVDPDNVDPTTDDFTPQAAGLLGAGIGPYLGMADDGALDIGPVQREGGGAGGGNTYSRGRIVNA